jgi:hypothetical protein
MYRRTGSGEVTADILCYSISLDTIEKVSSLSTTNFGGLALQSSDGKSIYYFGGRSSSTVHKFIIETNVKLVLPTALPYSAFVGSGVSINGTHFIFSGDSRDILEFSEEWQALKIIGDLPFDYGSDPLLSTAAVPSHHDGVWLFAGNRQQSSVPVLLFNVTSKVVYNQVANITTDFVPSPSFRE